MTRRMSGLGRRTVLAGAAGALAAPALAQGAARTLRYRANTDLVTLDPVTTISTPTQEAAFMIYDQLFGLDASLTARPQMVDRYEASADGLTWRFALREGLFFHDGEPVRARDVVATIGRWGQRERFGMLLRERTDEVRAVDDRQFEIRLKRKFPLMLRSLAAKELCIMPERVAAHKDAFSNVTDHTGSGPFVFLADEWVSGARAAFRRNERYVPRREAPSLVSGGKAVFVDRVEWFTMPDTATATAALQAGEIDLMYKADPELLPVLQRNPRIVIDFLDRFGAIVELVFNTLIPPLDNPALRRALLHLVDQDACMRAGLGDHPELFRTGVGVFSPETPLANDAGIDVLAGPVDLAHVRSLVQQSGYKGEPIVFMMPTDTPLLFASGQVMAQAMKDAGLNIVVQTMDWGTLVSRRNQVKTGGWHCHLSINPGQNDTPAGHYFLTSAYYRDASIDALRAAWIEAPDLAAQQRIGREIQLRYFENPATLPLGQYYFPSAYRVGVSGVVKSPWAVFWGVRKA